jgi:hypothetical protein
MPSTQSGCSHGEPQESCSGFPDVSWPSPLQLREESSLLRPSSPRFAIPSNSPAQHATKEKAERHPVSAPADQRRQTSHLLAPDLAEGLNSASESLLDALPQGESDLHAHYDLGAPASLPPAPPSPTHLPENCTAHVRHRRRCKDPFSRHQCKQQSRHCGNAQPRIIERVFCVTVIILVVSICSAFCLLKCHLSHQSVPVCPHGLRSHVYEPLHACQDLTSVTSDTSRQSLLHCLLLLLQHMHGPVAQLQGDSLVFPALAAYEGAVLDARAPLDLAMHRSWTKDAELRRAAADLSESMSQMAGGQPPAADSGC